MEISKIQLPDDVYFIINLPKNIYGGILYINSKGDIFTFKYSLDNKTIIHSLNCTVGNDAFWYDGGIFFKNKDDNKLYRFDIITKKSDPYNNILISDGNNS